MTEFELHELFKLFKAEPDHRRRPLNSRPRAITQPACDHVYIVHVGVSLRTPVLPFQSEKQAQELKYQTTTDDKCKQTYNRVRASESKPRAVFEYTYPKFRNGRIEFLSLLLDHTIWFSTLCRFQLSIALVGSSLLGCLLCLCRVRIYADRQLLDQKLLIHHEADYSRKGLEVNKLDRLSC